MYQAETIDRTGALSSFETRRYQLIAMPGGDSAYAGVCAIEAVQYDYESLLSSILAVPSALLRC